MPTMDWTKIMELADLPPGFVLAGFLVANVLTFLVARGTSKDKVKSSMLEQTMDRQDKLDKRQETMFDQLQEQISTAHKDMTVIREELAQEKKRSYDLSQKYSRMIRDNHGLQQRVDTLKAEKRELLGTIGELRDKNASLEEQLILRSEEAKETRD